MYLAKGWFSTVYSWWSGSRATSASALEGDNVSNPGIELIVNAGIDGWGSSNAVASAVDPWTPPLPTILLNFSILLSR